MSSKHRALSAPQIIPSLVAASCVTMSAQGSVVAQEAQKLPEIVVVSPSPVAKAKKTVKTSKQKSNPQTPAAKPNATPAPVPAPSGPELDSASTADAGLLVVPESSFVPLSIATSREIEAKQGNTLTDTLATKPGISGSTFAPGANRPVIRGLANARVRIQENGISSQDVSTLSEDHAFPIDPYAADHAEVIRGPATLRYGSQAIGGVVSVENNRIPTYLPIHGFDARIRGGYSSVDDGRDGAFSANAGAGNFVVHADAFKRQADDYDTPQGRQSNSFVDTDGVSIGGSIIGSDGFAGVSFTQFNSLYGIPGEDARIDMQQEKFNSKGEWRIEANGIEAVRYWFGASAYQHNEVSPDGEIGSRFLNDEQEGRVEIQHQPVETSLGALSGAVGIQISNRETTGLSLESGENLLEPSTTRHVAGFIFEELQLTPLLRMQAAGRIEKAKVDGTGVEDPFGTPAIVSREVDFTPVSASLGSLYEFPLGIVGRLTASYVERAPEAQELFSKGAHEATGTFEIGDANLGLEAASTIEAGFKRAQGAFRFDTSVYYTRFNDFIFKQATPGVMCDDTLASCGTGTELQHVTFQQRDATFYGVELAAQYDVSRVWDGVWGIDAQYDFVNAKFSNGENVPRIPPHRLGGGLYYKDAEWFFRVGVLHAFDQDRLGLGETPTDGYTLLSAELSYTQKMLETSGIGTAYTIGIKGENLADDEVRNHSSFLKDEVLQPGASVRVFGDLKLN